MTRIDSKKLTERRGITFISSVADSCHSIFREIPHTDIGIDGTLELFSDGKPIGQADVQSKSGDSYFLRPCGADFLVSTDTEHIEYWISRKNPVILVISRSLASGGTEGYWVNLSEYIESNPAIWNQPTPTIRIRSKDRFDASFSKDIRFSMDGYYSLREIKKVHADLLKMGRNGVNGVHLLLCGALGDGMLCFQAGMYAELSQSLSGSGAVGTQEHEFMTRYAVALTSNQLIESSAGAIDKILYEKLLHPSFILPLTSRGMGVVRFCRANGPSVLPALQHHVRKVGLISIAVGLEMPVKNFLKARQLGDAILY